MEKNTNIPSLSTLIKQGIPLNLLQSVLPSSGIRFTPRRKENQGSSRKTTGGFGQEEAREKEEEKEEKIPEGGQEEGNEAEGQEEWADGDGDEDGNGNGDDGVTRQLQISVHSYRGMTLEERREMMDVLERNMKVMYQNSTEGWSRQKKTNELSAESANMRFILAQPTPSSTTNPLPTTSESESELESPAPSSSNQPNFAGFIAFTMARTLASQASSRASPQPPPSTNKKNNKNDSPPLTGSITFTPVLEHNKPSEGIPCLYCYEIQVTPEYQGTLGKHLMQLMHHIAKEIGVRDVRLKVFKSNVRAIGFYEGLGYVIHCDPGEDYVIMRKLV